MTSDRTAASREQGASDVSPDVARRRTTSAVRLERVRATGHLRLAAAVRRSASVATLRAHRLDEAPHGGVVGDREVVAGRSRAAGELVEHERRAPDASGSRDQRDGLPGLAGRRVQRRPPTSSRPPEGRILHQNGHREQPESRAQEPGRRTIARRRPPSVREGGAVRRPADVQVEACGADVLEDDLSVAPPGASRQVLPTRHREGGVAGLHVHADRDVARVDRVRCPQLPRCAFGDQVAHPVQRAVDRETRARGSQDRRHRRALTSVFATRGLASRSAVS